MHTRRSVRLGLLASLLLLAGCECGDPSTGMRDGGDDGGAQLDGAPDDAVSMRCSNGSVEGTEECDDGNRDSGDGCSATCTIECGDGMLTGGEICDPAIAAGEAGACPTACDDGDSCTTDSLSGSDCSVECVFGPITGPADDDGCCPAGADATTDSDCTSVCGNGILESGEACDTAIAAGTAGSCPTVCDDGDFCTTDALSMDGTCAAACEVTPITTAIDGDMCCPAGETLATDSDCAIACGDGVVSAGESCDTGIVTGVGACPAACDDGNVCTTDMLSGGGTCNATCSASAITTPIDGDGCCPPGATIGTDSDCTATCGDGVVSGGESCDTAITSGAGRCPSSCNDMMACTRDMLVGAGTCSASCTFTPITTPMGGDGCCPSGATIGTDSDCPAVCGDGVVTASAMETCDTAITTGAGRCPTMCNDMMACTTDMLVNGGSCRAACTFTAITAPTDGDGCCPSGATECADDDCAVRCGDGCVSTGEACDDGNTVSGDGCSATCTTEVTATAFRLTDLDLKDPHIYANVFGCNDATNTIFGFIDGVNPLLQDNIQMDGDGDGMLDLSIAQVFRPLVQTAGSSTPTDLVFPDCTAPMSSTACTLPAGSMRVGATAMNSGGSTVCLPAVSGTTYGYSPAIVYPTAMGGTTCYTATAGSVSFDLGGIPITLTNASIGGEWFGTPATEIRDGLIIGFLSEADANRTIIPDGTTGQNAIDCMPIGSLLPGGNPPARTASDPPPPMGCADGSAPDTPMDPPANCSTHSDLDTGPGGVRGWYFYLNFSAARVSMYTEL